jgi:hypothetical protein
LTATDLTAKITPVKITTKIYPNIYLTLIIHHQEDEELEKYPKKYKNYVVLKAAMYLPTNSFITTLSESNTSLGLIRIRQILAKFLSDNDVHKPIGAQ